MRRRTFLKFIGASVVAPSLPTPVSEANVFAKHFECNCRILCYADHIMDCFPGMPIKGLGEIDFTESYFVPKFNVYEKRVFYNASNNDGHGGYTMMIYLEHGSCDHADVHRKTFNEMPLAIPASRTQRDGRYGWYWCGGCRPESLEAEAWPGYAMDDIGEIE